MLEDKNLAQGPSIQRPEPLLRSGGSAWTFNDVLKSRVKQGELPSLNNSSESKPRGLGRRLD